MPTHDAMMMHPALLMRPDRLATLPLWVTGSLLCGGAVLGAILLGLATTRLLPASLREDHNFSVIAVLSVVGTTYAVLLAFVAMLGWETYAAAGQDVASEAAVIGSIDDLSRVLPGPAWPALRQALRTYVRDVTDREWPAQERGLAVARTDPALASARRMVLQAAIAEPGNAVVLAILADMEKVAAARAARLRAAHGSIPMVAWFVLLAGGGISIVLAAMLAANDLRLHLAMIVLLALSGALVLLIVVKLSSPFRGDQAVSDEPFRQLLLEPSP